MKTDDVGTTPKKRRIPEWIIPVAVVAVLFVGNGLYRYIEVQNENEIKKEIKQQEQAASLKSLETNLTRIFAKDPRQAELHLQWVRHPDLQETTRRAIKRLIQDDTAGPEATRYFEALLKEPFPLPLKEWLARENAESDNTVVGD